MPTDRYDTAKARVLADAATPGPWEHSFDSDTGGTQVSDLASGLIAMVPEKTYGQSVDATQSSAEFIAAARTLVPEMADAIDTLHTEVDAKDARIAELEKQRNTLAILLDKLRALVWGEASQLLNEDSGGDARLDLEIEAALAQPDSGDGG